MKSIYIYIFQISVGTWWFLVANQCCLVFCWSYLYLQNVFLRSNWTEIKFKKKKKTRSVCVEEDEERKKKKRKKIQRMTEQRDLPRRGQSREKRWEAWEWASCKGRAERWDEGCESSASSVRELMNFYGYFRNWPSAQR